MSTSKSSKGFIAKSSVHRLLRDVKQIMVNPLASNGIFYHHDEEDMLKGYAMIIGPEETPYFNGYYFFELNFPNNYPHSPPVVYFCTNGDGVRFNPNLYRNGKVCISILNTWKGEQWTSCQTIRSVLLTLVTLLHNKPLTNEPGFTETHPLNEKYNKIIEYENYKTAVYKVLNQSILNDKFLSFFPIIKKHILKHKLKIQDKIKSLADSEINDEEVYCRMYSMKSKLEYKKLYKDLDVLFEKLSN